MKAIVWHGNDTYCYEEVSYPQLDPRQVIVKAEAAAICNSDFHLEDWACKPPIIPGHEIAGVVVEVGKKVKTHKVGDRVALDPVQRCGKCYNCKHGIEHLCINCRHLGGERAPGGWAQYVPIDGVNVHRMPKNVDMVSASIAEPVAVCLESFLRANMKPRQSVLIIGDGPFGFIHAMIAKALKASKIIVSGHYDNRLKRIAKGTGALICNSHKENLDELIPSQTDGLGVDIVIEASGAGPSPTIGLKALKARGRLVIFSYVWKPEPLDMGLISMKELVIVGSCRSLNCYAVGLKMMSQGKIKAEQLVDLTVPMSDFDKAVETLKKSKQDIFKAVLLPHKANA
jgi:threonine dehydrogenase-like Zn-dependent dehydrogenase